MDNMIEAIANINPIFAIFIISCLPFIELRGGILLGVALGMPWLEVFIICLIGNILPIPFIIVFGRYIIDNLEKTKLFGNFVKSYKAKLLGKSKWIDKYGFWGLILFVGIPAPGTGAWSGSVLALLLDIRMKKAIPAIFLGLLLAGTIMSLGSHGLFSLF